MSNDTITALAREYAEWVTEAEGGSNAYIPAETAIASAFLHWLCKRFCLVEKNKVEEEYHEANICRTHVERYGAQWGALTAKMTLMERFFPDLGKEVEK